MLNTTRVFIIEGLDALGKSSLIKGIRDTLGYFEVIHFNKPQNLKVYDEQALNHSAAPARSDKHESQFIYQRQAFQNMMDLVVSNAYLIFDRAHLGEFVYSPLYRNYQGDYVFELEETYGLKRRFDIRLILLTEDFTTSRHFIDDGHSLGPVDRRREEQALFVKAFYRSTIKDKRIINVTAASTGKFRPGEEILKDALASGAEVQTYGF